MEHPKFAALEARIEALEKALKVNTAGKDADVPSKGRSGKDKAQ